MISVVVPVRNDPRQLRACLQSLRGSTLADYELIVVDDASSDDTGDVARGMGAQVLRLERQSGPGAARNRGAEAARGEHLFFVDADVCVHPDTLQRVAEAFAGDPGIDALFGSYDTTPGAGNLLGQYKNLFHHFVHQQGAYEASTFWSGCGAIKRSVFLEAGGFDQLRYRRPCIEDIELGARLRRAGRRIVLRKEIQASHLKRWTLKGIVMSDVWDRGVPWTELILREKNLPNDLNLTFAQRLCAALAYALLGTILVGAFWQPWVLLIPVLTVLGILGLDAVSANGGVPWWAATLGVLGTLLLLAAVISSFGAFSLVPLGLLAVIVAINRRFYAFFAKLRHPLFAAFVVPLHVIYYLYSGVALGIGILRHLWNTRLAGSARVKDAAAGPR